MFVMEERNQAVSELVNSAQKVKPRALNIQLPFKSEQAGNSGGHRAPLHEMQAKNTRGSNEITKMEWISVWSWLWRKCKVDCTAITVQRLPRVSLPADLQ